MPVMSLIARLDLNKQPFDKKLQSTETDLDKFSNKIGRRFSERAIGAALTGTIALLGREAFDSAKQIDELASKLRISVEEAHKLHLASMLGGSTGKAGLFFNDEDTENLRIVWRTFVKIKDIATTIVGKLITKMPGTIGNFLSVFSKETGFVSGEKTDLESEEEKRLRMAELTRQAHVAEQEEVLKLEKESAVLDRQTRLAKMTDAGRRNELLKEQAILQQNLVGTDPDDIGTMMMKKRLSEVNLSLAQSPEKLAAPFRSPLAGAFVGGFNPTQNIGRDMLTEVRRIVREINRGIEVRDVKP